MAEDSSLATWMIGSFHLPLMKVHETSCRWHASALAGETLKCQLREVLFGGKLPKS